MEVKAGEECVEWAGKSEQAFASINENPNENIWQVVKKNRWVVLYCCCMTISPMVFGFDVITVGIVTAMPALQYADPLFIPVSFTKLELFDRPLYLPVD
jgi:hypothetical protein